MSNLIHTVTVEFSQMNYADAQTLRDIINDLGFNAVLTTRSLDYSSPIAMRDTRLGWIILTKILTKYPRRLWTIDEVGDELIEYHYAPASAAVVLSRLADAGDVERVARGRYKINPKVKVSDTEPTE